MSPPPGQASNALTTQAGWSDEQRSSTAKVVEYLAENILANNFSLVGLSGAPGCGKSTLAELLAERLRKTGVDALVLSLDDYYLGKAERLKAARQHPLFSQRGVPGTHDWGLLIEHLDRLSRGDIGGLVLPRFDKMNDDRTDDSITVATRPRVVILEGWVIGAPPQEIEQLANPVNQFESKHDSSGTWRTAVNRHLHQYHLDLGDRVDASWFMSAPGWNQIVDWRWQQEQQNAESENGGYLQSRPEVVDFLDRFQRLASHMIETAGQWADVIIDIDPDHLLSIRN